MQLAPKDGFKGPEKKRTHNRRNRQEGPLANDPAPEDQILIERFSDALWLERGLSANTLGSYQSDLRHAALWLAQAGTNLAGASRADLQAYLAAHRYGVAYPDELVAAFEETSGQEIDDLYEFWILGQTE